jgi:hypothetical protein
MRSQKLEVMSLKIISLNIEGDNHYNRIFPFLQGHLPDVICLMEFWKVDLSLFEEKLGMHGVFVPMCTVTKPNPYRLATKGPWGIALFSKYPFHFTYRFYKGDSAYLPELVVGAPNDVNRAVMFADIQKEALTYHVAMTHFTWADNGGTNAEQFRDMDAMLPLFDGREPIVFVGDFNAPRGLEIFSKLASTFTDNIPADVATTMDNNLHRAGNRLAPLVVDGFFTRGYTATNVRVVAGVSDHCALVGDIE